MSLRFGDNRAQSGGEAPSVAVEAHRPNGLVARALGGLPGARRKGSQGRRRGASKHLWPPACRH